MISKEVRKYLILNVNDSPRRYYQVKGSFCGKAVCPTNPNKFSDVECQVSFSCAHEIISIIRISAVGPPPITAACNLVVSESKIGTVERLIEVSREEHLLRSLCLDPNLSESYGLNVLEKAVDMAVTNYNNLKK